MKEMETQKANLFYLEQQQEERQPIGLVAQRQQKAPRKHALQTINSFSRCTTLCPELQELWWDVKLCFTGSNLAGAPLMTFSPRGRVDPEHSPPHQLALAPAPRPHRLWARPSALCPAGLSKPWGSRRWFSMCFLHPYLCAESELVLGLVGATSRLSGCRHCPISV